jgi:hypothetical protein
VDKLVEPVLSTGAPNDREMNDMSALFYVSGCLNIGVTRLATLVTVLPLDAPTQLCADTDHKATRRESASELRRDDEENPTW